MGRNINRAMGKVNKVTKYLTGALLISALVLGSLTYNQNQKIINQTVIGAIIPHHLLVENYIDQFYKKVSRENPDIKTIILLSPNHFNFGFGFMQTTDGPKFLDIQKIQQLAENSPIKIEPKYFQKEHGITNHLPFIKKYFPEAKIIPIIFKKSTPQNRLDTLVKNLTEIIDQKTLIIASIDFTHYENENTALKNDQRTIDWLKNIKNEDISKIKLQDLNDLAKTFDQTNEESVAFDSPESMYVLIKLLNQHQAINFKLFKRTSSASLLNINDPLSNTSHIFGEFY